MWQYMRLAGREGYTFFERWYSHEDNPRKAPEGFSVEKARELVAMAADKMKKRDLLYHGLQKFNPSSRN